MLIRILILLLVWVVWTFHRGTLTPPSEVSKSHKGTSEWIAKEKAGLNHLVLIDGTDYERGVRAGAHEKALLYQQEKQLLDRVDELTGLWVLRAISFISMSWFYGLDNYVDRYMLDEMYGVSKSTDEEFKNLADGYTRQLAYHALHEVGQYFVDHGADVYGCTVFAVPVENHWVLGRNFDFEGGAIFDDEKIVKWVFPDHGHSFVSVIWAGMVGGVTAVNDQGLYISINASGSKDFRRLGTPTTLLVTKVLQESNSLEDAIDILVKTPIFITDIFVLADPKTQRVVRVEKSPRRIDIINITEASAITNHQASPLWQNDSVNQFRKNELTSQKRLERAEQLLAENKTKFVNDQKTEMLLIEFLRDHADKEGALPLGHRASIDPLVATHSILYNTGSEVFFINQGPGSHGRYLGYDLKKSFKQKTPVLVKEYPADSNMTMSLYRGIRNAESETNKAIGFAKKKKCIDAEEQLKKVPDFFHQHYVFLQAQGDVKNCFGETAEAKQFWQKALAGRPAYKSEVEKLQERLAK